MVRKRAWYRGKEITDDASSADTGGGTDAMNGSSSYGRSLAAPFGKVMGCVWVVFLAYPALGLLRTDPSPVWLAAGAIGLAVFAGLYLRLVFVGALPPETARDARARRTGLLARLVALALLLNVVYGEGGYWLVLFLFCSAVAVSALPGRAALAAVAGLTVVAALAGWAVGASASLTGTHVLLSGLIGVSQIGHARLTRTVAELRAAREELARLAVAEERLRFARDLHDLLGHSLSLVALKSELAGRLLPDDPGRAAGEVRDVERVAREALREVREAVSGYRRPTLCSELDGARGMLDAAGVDRRVEDGVGDLPPAADAVLAWAVREGVTNVVRHSRAKRCEIRVWREADEVRMEVKDDGRVEHRGTPASAGSGLSGLAERVAASGGRLEAKPDRSGGFRLRVELPAGADPAAGEPVVARGVGEAGR